MAVRPFIMSGVAFAAAGAVAATVALAPPMSPGEVRVARDTQVNLNALITNPDLVNLINVYFGELPDDADAAGAPPGFIGLAGVVHQLLLGANANDPDAKEVLDAYFGSGLADVVRIYLTRGNTDQVTVDQINTYFGGGLSELVRYRMLLFNGDPTQRAYINTFFGDAVNDDGSEDSAQNGVQGLFYKGLVNTGLSTEQRQLLDTFFNAPTKYNSQAVDVDGTLTGNSNPARRGSFGVLYNTIKNSGLSPDQQATLDQFWDGGTSEVVKQRLLASTGDPTQKLDIETFFDGGIFENIRWRLLAGANGDQNSIDLTNEYFDNGISGVVRYLLVGPAPVAPPPEEPPAQETLLRAASVNSAPAVTADPVETTPVVDKKLAARVAPAPAPVVADAPKVDAAPVVADAPKVEAAPAPAAQPAAKTDEKADEKTGGTTDVTDAMKSGNKVEVDPIILEGGGGGASKPHGWGMFGQIAEAIGKAISGANAPASSPTGGTEGAGQ